MYKTDVKTFKKIKLTDFERKIKRLLIRQIRKTKLIAQRYNYSMFNISEQKFQELYETIIWCLFKGPKMPISALCKAIVRLERLNTDGTVETIRENIFKAKHHINTWDFTKMEIADILLFACDYLS